MFWWRTMARVWSATLACPWNWREIASYGLVKRKMPPSVRSAHKSLLDWKIITTWSCWNDFVRAHHPVMVMLVVGGVQNCGSRLTIRARFPSHLYCSLLSRWAQSATWHRKCWRERWTSGTASPLWNRWTCMPLASSTGRPSWDALTFFQVRTTALHKQQQGCGYTAG